MKQVRGKLLPGSGIGRQHRRALVNGEAGMPEAIQDFDGGWIDFPQAQKLLQQFMAKEQHELLRIGSGKELEGTVWQENAVGDNAVAMGV